MSRVKPTKPPPRCVNDPDPESETTQTNSTSSRFAHAPSSRRTRLRDQLNPAGRQRVSSRLTRTYTTRTSRSIHQALADMTHPDQGGDGNFAATDSLKDAEESETPPPPPLPLSRPLEDVVPAILAEEGNHQNETIELGNSTIDLGETSGEISLDASRSSDFLEPGGAETDDEEWHDAESDEAPSRFLRPFDSDGETRDVPSCPPPEIGDGDRGAFSASSASSSPVADSSRDETPSTSNGMSSSTSDGEPVRSSIKRSLPSSVAISSDSDDDDALGPPKSRLRIEPTDSEPPSTVDVGVSRANDRVGRLNRGDENFDEDEPADGVVAPSTSAADESSEDLNATDGGGNDIEVLGVQRGIIDVEEEAENRPEVIKSINPFIVIEDSDDEDVNIIDVRRNPAHDSSVVFLHESPSHRTPSRSTGARSSETPLEIPSSPNPAAPAPSTSGARPSTSTSNTRPTSSELNIDFDLSLVLPVSRSRPRGDHNTLSARFAETNAIASAARDLRASAESYVDQLRAGFMEGDSQPSTSSRTVGSDRPEDETPGNNTDSFVMFGRATSANSGSSDWMTPSPRILGNPPSLHQTSSSSSFTDVLPPPPPPPLPFRPRRDSPIGNDQFQMLPDTQSNAPPSPLPPTSQAGTSSSAALLTSPRLNHDPSTSAFLAPPLTAMAVGSSSTSLTVYRCRCLQYSPFHTNEMDCLRSSRLYNNGDQSSNNPPSSHAGARFGNMRRSQWTFPGNPNSPVVGSSGGPVVGRTSGPVVWGIPGSVVGGNASPVVIGNAGPVAGGSGGPVLGGNAAGSSVDNATPERPSDGSAIDSSNRVSSPATTGNISCPVCLDTLPEIKSDHRSLMSTNCGHLFCNTCIKDAIKSQKKCPTCRKKLSPKSVHPIYL